MLDSDLSDLGPILNLMKELPPSARLPHEVRVGALKVWDQLASKIAGDFSAAGVAQQLDVMEKSNNVVNLTIQQSCIRFTDLVRAHDNLVSVEKTLITSDIDMTQLVQASDFDGKCAQYSRAVTRFETVIKKKVISRMEEAVGPMKDQLTKAKAQIQEMGTVKYRLAKDIVILIVRLSIHILDTVRLKPRSTERS